MKKSNSSVKILILTLFTIVGGLLVTAGSTSAATGDEWKSHSILCKTADDGGEVKSFVVVGSEAFGVVDHEKVDICDNFRGPTRLPPGNVIGSTMESMGTCGFSDWTKKMCKEYVWRITSIDIENPIVDCYEGQSDCPYQKNCVSTWTHSPDGDFYYPEGECAPLQYSTETNKRIS